MKRRWTTLERIAAGTITLLVAITFAVQTSVNEGSPLVAFAQLFRFFTIWSNFSAGLVMGWIALGRHVSDRVLFALSTALMIVALVYHALLAADHHPDGLDWWTNLAFHTMIPAATIAWWVFATRREAFAWSYVPYVMVAPLIYTVFALGYGAVTGFYAYFFIDKSALGWGQLFANMAGLAIFFMIMGALLLGLRSLVGRNEFSADA